MLNSRLLMAASWYGHSDGSGQGVELLYMGLWQVAGQLEPEPIPREVKETQYHPYLIDMDFGIMRTLGMIGEWYAQPLPAIKEPDDLSPSSLGDVNFGIMRTLGMIGEWYAQPLPQYKRVPYPGYSYMDTVLDEL